jgi:isoleucyl-tRNA synthetase
LEGRARELVHLIQNMRRSAEFDIADHIVTYYGGDEALEEVIAAHGDYIRQETLSRELTRGVSPEGAYTEEQKVNGLAVVLGVVRE